MAAGSFSRFHAALPARWSRSARGVNLPLMAVQDHLGRDLVALDNPHVNLVERSIATRTRLDFAYDSVFVDLDDTLVLNGHAVPQTMAFLYQSKADGKKVNLITRHAFDVAGDTREGPSAAASSIRSS
jgi:hypothetical protein